MPIIDPPDGSSCGVNIGDGSRRGGHKVNVAEDPTKLLDIVDVVVNFMCSLRRRQRRAAELAQSPSICLALPQYMKDMAVVVGEADIFPGDHQVSYR